MAYGSNAPPGFKPLLTEIHWIYPKQNGIYMVYNTKTGKYTGPFTKGDEPVKKPKPKKTLKTKPMKKIAKEIVKLAKDVKKLKKPAKYVRSPIVELLVQAREAAGITRADVAKATKRHASQIHNFENKMKQPRAESIEAYAKAIGYDVVTDLKPIPGWKPGKR